MIQLDPMVIVADVAERGGYGSASTISTQKKAAYQKLGIRSDVELFRIRHLLDSC